MRIELPNLDEIFPTQNEKQQVKDSLMSLLSNEGWKIMKKLLDNDIEKLEYKLKWEDFENIEKRNEARDKLASLVLLSEYPENIIKQLTDQPTQEYELDPYSKTESKDSEKGRSSHTK